MGIIKFSYWYVLILVPYWLPAWIFLPWWRNKIIFLQCFLSMFWLWNHLLDKYADFVGASFLISACLTLNIRTYVYIDRISLSCFQLLLNSDLPFYCSVMYELHVVYGHRLTTSLQFGGINTIVKGQEASLTRILHTPCLTWPRYVDVASSYVARITVWLPVLKHWYIVFRAVNGVPSMCNVYLNGKRSGYLCI